MSELYYVLPQVAFSMPAIATLVVGVVLLWLRRERLAPRAWALGVAGLAVLLAGSIADLIYVAALPSVIRDNGLRESQALFAAAGLAFLVLHVLGVALLIAALLATARPNDPWGQPPPPPPQIEPSAEFG